MSLVIGIDFGTSNSAASCVVNGETTILADETGSRLTPSVVSFGKNNQVLIGQAAKEQAYRNPKKTVHSIKRLIGRKFYSSEIEKARALLPFDLVEIEGQNVGVKIDERIYTPQEIAAIILKKMKSVAHFALKTDIERAVVTVPAYFNDNQRQTTREACDIAGLKAMRMINEPTAAALAYGFGKSLNQNIVIYDLGGGTFDLSILKLKDQVFEVLGTAGDTFLGGDDFDDRLIDLIAEHFLKKHSVDLRKIPAALPVLRAQAEKTKKRLSYSERTDLYIPKIIQRDDETIDLHMTVSRDQLKDHCNDLVQRTFAVCDEALANAGLKPSEVDEIILVGGPTKMPILFEAVQSYFNKAPLNELNPDEVVSMGAAIQAHSLTAKGVDRRALLLDVTPLDLGVATVGGFVETIINKNSPIPAEAKQVFSTTKDNQTTVDIRVFQGKDRRIESSTQLGDFSLTGFKPGKAGEISIEVSFSINTDGIVEVSAIEKETGVSQNISVKLGAVMGAEKAFSSRKKTESYNEVQLKDEWKDFEKVLMYIPSHSGVTSVYKEGFLKTFDPATEEFELFSEDKSGYAVRVERKYVGWVAFIDDFSNIPRYVRALCVKPEVNMPDPKYQLYEFKFKNNECLFAQSELPKVRADGFWAYPHLPLTGFEGKVYIFSSQLKDSQPILNAAKDQLNA